MKRKRLILILAMVAILSTMSWAQRFELMPFAGYRTSGGFDIDSIGHSRFTIKDGLAYGVSLGVMLSPTSQVEFMWSQTNSQVTGSIIQPSPEQQELFDIHTSQFHVNFIYLFPRSSSNRVIPYFLVGLGLTLADPKGEVNGETRFSWSLGGGIKIMASERVGLRFQGKWIPTYINTSSEVWCDWWGFCYAVPLSQYMSQGEFTGGIFFRF
jgi:opacity protein-like surface antigen